MRCELAASLIHNPAILFLDEPTIGLDIVVKTEIREFLKSLNQRYETTILLTTHDLQDIEALCSRVIMLDDGRIIYDGGLEELKVKWGKGKEVVLQFEHPTTLARLQELTRGLDVAWQLENELSAKVFIPHERANVSEVLSRVVGVLQIQDIKINETNTDDIVREIYKSGSAEVKRQEECRSQRESRPMLSAYLEVIRMRFLMMLAYRVNYYSGILIYALNIGSYYFVYKAIYGEQAIIGGLTLGQMTTYVAISWMGRAFYFNNLDREIANEIRDGSVAIQFIRPYNYVFVKMMQGFGEGIFRLLLFTTPGMIFIWLLLPIQFPTDPSLWVIYFVMLFFSFLINTQLNIITGLFAFFLENNEGLMRMKRVAVDLFSGLIIPISFFPGWSKSVLEWLPFQAITYLPSAVFTGKITGTAIFQNLGVQVLWFLLLIIPIYVLWVKSKTRLFVQGG